MGLPETGKTSFLAAFSFYLESEMPEKKLKEYQLSSNTTYITGIRQKWLRAEAQERTKVTATLNPKTEADIFIENLTGARFTLHIPDFFGETFENQFIDRNIELDYLDHLRTSSGILLFIHPEKVKMPILIEDLLLAHKVEQAINNEVSASDVDSGSPRTDDMPVAIEKTEEIHEIFEAAPFREEDCPTQVILVDLLESHLEYTTQNTLKLSVIISAWDTVKLDDKSISPSKWLEVTMPLLSQYLQANSQRLDTKIFGVSAQGGSFEKKEQVEQLTSLDNPMERVIIQEGDSEHKNIAAPIEWILD